MPIGGSDDHVGADMGRPIEAPRSIAHGAMIHFRSMIDCKNKSMNSKRFMDLKNVHEFKKSVILRKTFTVETWV